MKNNKAFFMFIAMIMIVLLIVAFCMGLESTYLPIYAAMAMYVGLIAFATIFSLVFGVTAYYKIEKLEKAIEENNEWTQKPE